MKHYTINKFGGSSLANADSFRQVVNILQGQDQVAVVSAVAGITNALQNMLDVAVFQGDYQTILKNIIAIHQTIIDELNLKAVDELKECLAADTQILMDLLHTVALTKSYSLQIQELVIAYGETWSAQILVALLKKQRYKSKYLDASELIFVNRRQAIIEVDWQKSQQALQSFLQKGNFSHLVITGFIASDASNKRVTLGRNGSDFSAAIVATLFAAKNLYIWTDVDGIYSADPRRVPKAFILPQISYQEILELSYFGAEVLHPQTIAPAITHDIAIHIKNTFNPTVPGTLITVESDINEYLIRGISSIDDIALVNIAGPGLVGVTRIQVASAICT